MNRVASGRVGLRDVPEWLHGISGRQYPDGGQVRGRTVHMFGQGDSGGSRHTSGADLRVALCAEVRLQLEGSQRSLRLNRNHRLVLSLVAQYRELQRLDRVKTPGLV